MVHFPLTHGAAYMVTLGVTQAAPKSCGHVRGKKAVPREEAVARIRAAADARDESGSNIVIVARTDARQAESLDVSTLLPTIAFAASPNKTLLLTRKHH